MIQAAADLQEHGEAMFFNKENGSELKSSMMGYCTAANKDVFCQFVPVTYEPGINKGAKHRVAVTQSSAEVAEFRKFFKKGL